VKKNADTRSMSVAQLQREIKKIAAHIINRCASPSLTVDELEKAVARLRGLQDALALATERVKASA